MGKFNVELDFVKMNIVLLVFASNNFTSPKANRKVRFSLFSNGFDKRKLTSPVTYLQASSHLTQSYSNNSLSKLLLILTWNVEHWKKKWLGVWKIHSCVQCQIVMGSIK
jgi:hypothetical protein